MRWFCGFVNLFDVFFGCIYVFMALFFLSFALQGLRGIGWGRGMLFGSLSVCEKGFVRIAVRIESRIWSMWYLVKKKNCVELPSGWKEAEEKEGRKRKEEMKTQKNHMKKVIVV